jgi:hypothetical protein
MWTFTPTAGLKEFDEIPGLPDAWSKWIGRIFEDSLYGDSSSVLERLRKWGQSDADIRFYNPASMPVPTGSRPQHVHWNALPISWDDEFGSGTDELLSFLDEPGPVASYPQIKTRRQDEYCEWRVVRRAGKIVKVIFTSEPPEYYAFLWDDPGKIGRDKTRKLLIKLYRDRCGTSKVKVSDLATPEGNYNAFNRWNNECCVHMQYPPNTLGAEITLAADASILRQRNGRVLTEAQQLIDCGEYGNMTRQSDPSIGAAVNQFARENRFITLANPVGLYMTGMAINTDWRFANGKPVPKECWKVIQGSASSDPDKAMIVRAEFTVPKHIKATVSDILIQGEPVRFGAQLARFVDIRISVLVSSKQQLPPPGAIGCAKEHPPETSLRESRMRRRADMKP